jgi:hypothetical protein
VTAVLCVKTNQYGHVVGSFVVWSPSSFVPHNTALIAVLSWLARMGKAHM